MSVLCDLKGYNTSSVYEHTKHGLKINFNQAKEIKGKIVGMADTNIFKRSTYVLMSRVGVPELLIGGLVAGNSFSTNLVLDILQGARENKKNEQKHS